MSILKLLTMSWNKTQKFIVKNASHLLMGIGTTTSIGTVIFTAKVKPAADMSVAKARKQKFDRLKDDPAYENGPVKLSAWEWLKAVAKYYGPAAAMEMLSLFCFWMAHGIDIRRQAIWAGVATTAQEALREYQKKVQDMIGQKAEHEVRHDIQQDKVNALPAPPDANPQPPGTTKDWCIIINGDWQSPYFMNSYIGIKDAQNDINQEMIQNMYASESDLFWLLDPDRRWLKTTNTSGQCGWNIDRLLDLEISECDGPDHSRVLVISYKDKDGCDYPPRPQYDMLL